MRQVRGEMPCESHHAALPRTEGGISYGKTQSGCKAHHRRGRRDRCRAVPGRYRQPARHQVQDFPAFT